MIWEAQIGFVVIDKKGNDKPVKNNYIIQGCETFTEVESSLMKEFYDRAGFEIFSIKHSRIREIANTRSGVDDGLWLADVSDVFYDEDGEKKLMQYKILFFEKDFDSAKDFITKYLEQGYDLTLSALKLTKFIDVL